MRPGRGALSEDSAHVGAIGLSLEPLAESSDSLGTICRTPSSRALQTAKNQGSFEISLGGVRRNGSKTFSGESENRLRALRPHSGRGGPSRAGRATRRRIPSGAESPPDSGRDSVSGTHDWCCTHTMSVRHGLDTLVRGRDQCPAKLFLDTNDQCRTRVFGTRSVSARTTCSGTRALL